MINYITTGSSNSVLNGSPLKLEIVISKDLSGRILPMGAFTVENLDAIVANDQLEGLKCELLGKLKKNTEQETFPVPICNLSYDIDDKGKSSIIIHDDYDGFSNDGFDYLTLEITADKCSIDGLSKEIIISFNDLKNEENEIPVLIRFTVSAKEAKPEIKDFSSNSTVVAVSSDIELSWAIKGDAFILRKGIEVLKTGNEQEGDYLIKNILSGDHTYTLEVRKGNTSITKTVLIRALNKSRFYSSSNPSEFRIGNFCVSQDSSRLFSLMLKKDNNKAKIDHIAYSYTNDGFSGIYPKIELSDIEKKDLKPFAESPMIHMKSAGELHGRLFFIGGSSVKVMNSSNSVAIFNLDTKSGSRLSIIENRWPSRTAHSCVLFPHGDLDKIWLIGGVDKWGSGLNDIWVSGDGKTWENLQANGSVNLDEELAEMPWDKRCLAGVTVELDDYGSKIALLVGGGFSEMGGSETPDIWKWDKNNWEELTPLFIEKPSYLSSGLIFLGKDTPASTGFFELGGGYEKGNIKAAYFYKITLNNGKYGIDKVNSDAEELTTERNSKIIMGFFKGCMWYMVLTDEGDKGINYSKLFYWIPVPASETLILT